MANSMMKHFPKLLCRSMRGTGRMVAPPPSLTPNSSKSYKRVLSALGTPLRSLSTSGKLSSAFFESQHPLVPGTTFMDDTNVYQMLNKYETILLDCDGVLWGTDHFTHLSGVAKTIEKLRSLNKQLLFVTNNSLHAREAYVEKFHSQAGFHADIEDIFCTAYAAAVYMKDIAKVQGKCYMIGSKGMQDELNKLDIETIGFGPDSDAVSEDIDSLLNQALEDNVDAVAVGYDVNFNYNKLFKATSYLTDPKCHFIATNDLETREMIGKRHCQPLTGALVKAVAAASVRKPEVVGKPHYHLMETILDTHPTVDPKKTLMIGDSLRTDVAFAHRAGISSALVLSGETNEDRLDKLLALPKNSIGQTPDYVLPSVCFLAEFI
ncbi:hypothetical protein CAPTEDRAFT_166467 [Capitella teleta]|uniref:Uncharacterized protein n=1 Tax=Capitella teleta TaxID=283909 RepID=R7T542_CAPTE|nr:hypothetical protein CAPTEDRAFT_166467 [Capitella teleta]|eukprot:ELT88307.1 hypothetical protein CAPTEDRAFT_166467 [Capitella teleta]